MKKKVKTNFRQELKTAFLMYALAPVIIASLLVYFTLCASWYLTMINQNRKINSVISGKLESILDTYQQAVQALGQDNRLLAALAGKPIAASLYEALYAVSRQTEIACAFHVLTADLRVIMSNTTQLPWYAAQPYRLELGILKAAAACTGQATTEINKQPLNANPLPPITIALAIAAEGGIAGFLCVDLLYNDILDIISNPAADIALTDPFANIAATSLPQCADRLGKLRSSLQRNDRLFSRSRDHLFVSMRTLPHSGLSIVSITDTRMANTINTYTALFLIILFLVLAAILNVSAGNIAKRKTVVIDQIVAGLQKVRQGDLDKLIHIESPEEFRIIGEAFNTMLTDIKHLIAVNAEEIRQKALAEIRQLESHFNPHFLFNTLETIRYMLISDPRSASQMILNLSSLLRYSISNEKTQVRLSEDIGFITHYLMIQKCRFTNRFFYEVQIDKQALRCYIPRLLVQPLIENSLKHGFAGKEALTLNIKGMVNDNSLVIDIADNGCGMQQEKLLNLRSVLECETNASGHHGLYNVHRRIRLMYGLAFGLQIESCAGEGTQIRLTLPAVYKEADS